MQLPRVMIVGIFWMDGAYMAARMFGPMNPGAHFANAAKTLINAQIS
jgi:hypothetical protein